MPPPSCAPGLDDSEEDISFFNQGSNLSTAASTFTTGSFAASTVILAAPGVKGLYGVREINGGVTQSLDLNQGSRVYEELLYNDQLLLDPDYLLLLLLNLQ